MGTGRPPDAHELLVAQLAESLDLLERLKAEPPSAKMNLAIVLLEEARWRALNDLAASESPVHSPRTWS
jgi:hypothetical protein